MLVRENFGGPQVHRNRRIRPQDAQKVQTSHPPNPGAPGRALPKQGRRRAILSYLTIDPSKLARSLSGDGG